MIPTIHEEKLEMDNQVLRERLMQLHAELEKTEGVDDRDSEMLRDVMGHIQIILDHTDPIPPQRYISLGQRLEKSLKVFEESHPDLVMTIGRLLDHFAQV
jgi:hypothetical protein